MLLNIQFIVLSIINYSSFHVLSFQYPRYSITWSELNLKLGYEAANIPLLVRDDRKAETTSIESQSAPNAKLIGASRCGAACGLAVAGPAGVILIRIRELASGQCSVSSVRRTDSAARLVPGQMSPWAWRHRLTTPRGGHHYQWSAFIRRRTRYAGMILINYR